jgi:hypothetical protein
MTKKIRIRQNKSCQCHKTAFNAVHMSDDEPAPTPEVTILGIRINDDLRTKIREAARLEERTESSFARFYLGRAADAVLSETTNTSAEAAIQ